MTVALVPTMGGLHDGHRALLRAARAEADRVVMSLFVNPTQFGEGEDFTRYPRDGDRDRRIAAEEGVDEVYAPAVEDDLPHRLLDHRRVGPLAAAFEGASRPGHFAGVATVVLKLFQRVRPDIAVFGQKDAQQVAVIRRMVRDLDVPVALRIVPPCASRTASPVDPATPICPTTSGGARRRCTAPLVARDPALVEGDLDYLAVVDPDTFEPVEPRPGAIVIGAARFGSTRLIDNIPVEDS